MKVYLCSKFCNIEKVRKFIDQIRKEGHEITLDWTLHKPVEIASEGYSKYLIESGNQAKECIDSIKKCDIFIMHYEKEPEGTGRFVELGAAIALGKKIFLFGKNLDQKLFFQYPGIRKFNSLNDVLIEMKK